jgi:hypothetical protein
MRRYHTNRYNCPMCGEITQEMTVGTYGEHCWACDSPVTFTHNTQINQKGQNTMNEKKRSIGAKSPEVAARGSIGLEPAWETKDLYGPFLPYQDRLHFPLNTDDEGFSPEPSEASEILANAPTLPKEFDSDFWREGLVQHKRRDAYEVYATDPSRYQADDLAELGRMGMSYADAKEAAKGDKPRIPDTEHVWCGSCGAVEIGQPGSGVWDLSGLTLSAQRSARSCSHESRVGVLLANITPTDVTPYQMTTGAWSRRYRADQVHSPVSHGHITSGRMSVFDWHRTFVTGSAERRDRVKKAGMTDTETLESVIPSGAVRTTKGVSVLTAVDGRISGDSTIPYRSTPVGLVTETLHNGKKMVDEAKKAEILQKARDAKKAKAAKKVKNGANAEFAAKAGAKAAKRTKDANAAILADLAEIAARVTKATNGRL